MRRPQVAKLGARSVFHARQCALVQRDVAMRVDEAGQDELARRVDDRVFRALRPEPAIGGADMGDPVTLDNNEHVRDWIAPAPVDQRPILDQQPRPKMRHDNCLPIRATARLEQSRLNCHSDADSHQSSLYCERLPMGLTRWPRGWWRATAGAAS